MVPVFTAPSAVVEMSPTDPFTAIRVLSTFPRMIEVLWAMFSIIVPVSADPPTTVSEAWMARVVLAAASSTAEFTPTVMSPVFTAPSAVVAMSPMSMVGSVMLRAVAAAVVAASVAAMDRQKTAVERVDGVLPEQHSHAAQIANLMADTPQEPVRAEGWTPVGAV